MTITRNAAANRNQDLGKRHKYYEDTKMDQSLMDLLTLLADNVQNLNTELAILDHKVDGLLAAQQTDLTKGD